MSKGMPNAIAVLAVAERGAMFDPSAVFYMEKIAVGPECADVIDIEAGITENLRRIAKVKHSSVSELTVCILDRPRHAELDQGGARQRRPDPVHQRRRHRRARSTRPGRQSDVDVLVGVGGTPEGIVAACALKCIGGSIQAKLWPRDEAEREKALAAGHDLDRVLLHRRSGTRGQRFFAATGVTTGDLLRGVRYRGGGAYTQSIVMRSKSGTIRIIDSYHRLEKLRSYSLVDFGGDA